MSKKLPISMIKNHWEDLSNPIASSW